MKLLYFILGMLSYQVAIPIIDSIVTLIQTHIEVKKGELSLKINEINKNLGVEEVSTNAIGFVYEPKDEYEEEEE